MRAEQALVKLLLDYQFDNVLDIGSGDGRATKLFKLAGKDVTSIDINPDTNPTWVGDFATYPLTGEKFDCIWCSHVLEHQLDVGSFLRKISHTASKMVAITVPPMKKEIVGGHYTIWNMGLLIYNMVMAGFNCIELIGIKQGYNISVITPVKRISNADFIKIKHDKGDIETLQQFFPYLRSRQPDTSVYNVVQGFNGDIQELRWYSDKVIYE